MQANQTVVNRIGKEVHERNREESIEDSEDDEIQEEVKPKENQGV